MRRAAFLLFLTCFAGTAHALEPDEQLQFADGLYARKMYDFAVPEYIKFVKLYPSHAKTGLAFYRLGECYLQLKRPGEALPAFKDAFAAKGDEKYRSRAGFKLAELQIASGDHGAAVKSFRKLLSGKPTADVAAASLYFLGDSLLKLNRDDEAAQVFGDLINKHRTNKYLPPALIALGNIHAIEKEKKALTFYQRAIKASSSPRVAAEAWFRIAELHFREGRYDKSAHAYDKLFALYPEDERVPVSRLRATWALHNSGRHKDGLNRATTFLAVRDRDKKEDPEWLYLKANCERQLGNSDVAAKTYGKVLNDFGGSRFAGPAAYERGLTLYGMKKYRDVIRQLRSFKPKGKLRRDVFWLLAESHGALKDYDAAISQYRLLLKEFPNSNLCCDAIYRVGHLLQKSGKYDDASSWYTRIVEKFPDHKLVPQALFSSASCLLKAEKYKLAVEQWSQLVKEHPADSLVEEALYQLGMGQSYLRKDREAEVALRDLLKRFPRTRFAPESRYWLGLLMKDAGNHKKAATEFRAALALKPKPSLLLEVQFHLGVTLQKLKKYNEAADLFQMLVSSKRGKQLAPSLLEWLAAYRHDQKRSREALLAATALAETVGSPAWQQIGWCLVGRVHRAAGKSKKATAAFEKSLSCDARTAHGTEAALRLGEFRYEGRDYNKSIEYFKQAAKLASGDEQISVRARAYAGLARASRDKGELEEATRYFMTVAILFDDPELVPQCLYDAAGVFEKLGRHKDKREALKELAQRYPNSELVGKDPK